MQDASVETAASVRAIARNGGSHLEAVVLKLLEGVAFRDLRQPSRYNVISHGGDDVLGYLSNADVSFAIHYMKQNGRAVGKCRSLDGSWNADCNPAYTFAWEGWLIYNGKRI